MLVYIYSDAEEYLEMMTLYGYEVTDVRFTVVQHTGQDGLAVAWVESNFVQGWDEFRILNRLSSSLGLMCGPRFDERQKSEVDRIRALVHEAAELIGLKVGNGGIRCVEELRPRGVSK